MNHALYNCRMKLRIAPCVAGGKTRLLVLIALVVTGMFPAAGLACGKDAKLAALVSYAGTYAGDTPTALDADPVVSSRLQHLSASVRAELKRDLEVRGAVDLIQCHLALSGNAPHMGGEQNAILDVNLYSGAVTVALLDQGRIRIFLDEDPTAASGYQAVPYAVRLWAGMAAGGFNALNNPPPGVQLIRSARQVLEPSAAILQAQFLHRINAAEEVRGLFEPGAGVPDFSSWRSVAVLDDKSAIPLPVASGSDTVRVRLRVQVGRQLPLSADCPVVDALLSADGTMRVWDEKGWLEATYQRGSTGWRITDFSYRPD